MPPSRPRCEKARSQSIKNPKFLIGHWINTLFVMAGLSFCAGGDHWPSVRIAMLTWTTIRCAALQEGGGLVKQPGLISPTSWSG